MREHGPSSYKTLNPLPPAPTVVDPLVRLFLQGQPKQKEAGFSMDFTSEQKTPNLFFFRLSGRTQPNHYHYLSALQKENKPTVFSIQKLSRLYTASLRQQVLDPVWQVLMRNIIICHKHELIYGEKSCLVIHAYLFYYFCHVTTSSSLTLPEMCPAIGTS